MRKLLYVPIIHGEADLGSLGAAYGRKSTSIYGQKRWALHQTMVAGFWKSLADYLVSLDAASLKIYQDGLAAAGKLGHRVVEVAAARGSLNHQLVLQLLNRGAELRQTEEASLLVEELRLAQEELGVGNTSPDHPGIPKARLTEARDRFIAKTIDETLKPGEVGILFIGAYHQVYLYLPEDIVVEPVKEWDRVKAYFQELASGQGQKRLQELASYLTSPIAAQGKQ